MMPEHVERSDAFSDVAYDAIKSVMATPVRTLTDLREKADFIDDLEWWDAEMAQVILADLRELTGGA